MQTDPAIIARFNAFIKEADEVCDACVTLGHDDDSYDAGRWRDEATAMRDALERDDFEAAQVALDDSFIEAESPEAWLDEAEKRLDRLG